MSRILILIEGKEGKKFVKTIIENYPNIAEFDIIYQNEIDIDDKLKVDGINFYKIPFSDFLNFPYFKKTIYSKIIVVIKNRYFAEKSLETLQYYAEKNIYIDFVDFWCLNIEKENINIITIPELINSAIIDVLPNVPVFARNMGLRKGEILEVQVPASSSFKYKNVYLLNSENRNKWRIVAIYRNDNLILPTHMSEIEPYDRLLIVGQPNILKDVYKNIKKDVGMFPAPYGNNIYLLIDRAEMDRKEVSKLLKSAIYLQRKTKSKKLIIKIINPNLHRLDKLEKFENIEVIIDYFNEDKHKILEEDLFKFNVGLFIISNKFFYKNIEFLMQIKKPFLKVGKESIKKCSQTAVLLRDGEDVAKISPVVFDLSIQLDAKIKFFDIDPDNVSLTKKSIMKYYENLARMYYYQEKVEFIMSNDNPKRFVKEIKNICFFVPFNRNFPTSKLKAILLPDVQKVQILFDKYNQFMIPTKD